MRFESVRPGDGVELERCPACTGLWACGRHEPRGAQRFWTLWPFDAAAWDRVRSLPEGARLLREWHDAVLRESWLDLPGKERAVVERWRERTHREHNAIDSREPPRFLAHSGDVVRWLAGAREPRLAS
jgi:hypothetical protein